MCYHHLQVLKRILFTLNSRIFIRAPALKNFSKQQTITLLTLTFTASSNFSNPRLKQFLQLPAAAPAAQQSFKVNFLNHLLLSLLLNDNSFKGAVQKRWVMKFIFFFAESPSSRYIFSGACSKCLRFEKLDMCQWFPKSDTH